MDKNIKLAHLALNAGEVMIRSGAETYRVHDTMLRILSVSEQEDADAFAQTTLLVVTLPQKNGRPLTMMRTIHNSSTNLQQVCEVNALSSAFVSGKISLDEATEMLKKIHREQNRLQPIHIISYGILSGGFSFLRCPLLSVSIASFFTGILVVFLMLLLSSKRMPPFLLGFLCGCFIAFLACMMQFLLPAGSIDDIIVGSIMPLLPGITFSKAISDLMEGNTTSGYTKAIEALVNAASLAGGVTLILTYFL